MKKLLLVAIVLVLGAAAYAKIRSSPQTRACKQLDSLCAGEVDIGECTEDFDQAAKIVGPEVIDKAVDCMASADTCMEAVGCVAGASMHLVRDFERGFVRGAQ